MGMAMRVGVVVLVPARVLVPFRVLVPARVLVAMGMGGIGLHRHGRLHGVGSPLGRHRKCFPCGCRRIGHLFPPQVSRQSLVLRKSVRLVLQATQGLAQGHLQQQGCAIFMVTHEKSIYDND